MKRRKNLKIQNPNKQSTKIIYGILFALIPTICFGFVPVFLRYLTDYLDPWTVNGVRYTIGALTLFPFLCFTFYNYQQSPENYTDKGYDRLEGIWKAALVPTTINICGQVGWALCPYYLSASEIGIGIRLSFLYTVLFSLIFVLEERKLLKHPGFYIGFICCISGMALLSFEDILAFNTTSIIGIVIITITSGFWGAYAVCVRRYMKLYPPTLSFAVISVYTSFVLLILLFLFGDYSSLTSLDTWQWLIVIVSALIGVTLAHTFLYRSLNAIGPIVTSGILSIMPIFTFGAAFLFLGEALTFSQVVGGAIIISGSYALIMAQRKMSKL